jgi:hypothetical protein
MPKAKIISLVHSSFERQDKLCWMPVISIAYGGALDHEAVTVKLNRFWLAELTPDEYIACGWDAHNSDAHQKSRFASSKIPISLRDERGNLLVAYCAYSDELWGELNCLWKSLLQTISCACNN